MTDIGKLIVYCIPIIIVVIFYLIYGQNLTSPSEERAKQKLANEREERKRKEQNEQERFQKLAKENEERKRKEKIEQEKQESLQKLEKENEERKRNEKKEQNIIINEINTIKSKYNFAIWKNEMLENLDKTSGLFNLLHTKNYNEIYYGDLLNCFEWKFKRVEILLRDKYICQVCNKKDIYLHIHHKYYLKDKLPWDIENDALLTLCYDCHKTIHENNSIPVYKLEFNNQKTLFTKEEHKCNRCGGTGYIPKFKHVEGGVCFKCMGNLVNKGVFTTVLKLTYNELSNYNENLKRNEYKDFINNLSTDFLYQIIPDVHKDKLFRLDTKTETSTTDNSLGKLAELAAKANQIKSTTGNIKSNPVMEVEAFEPITAEELETFDREDLSEYIKNNGLNIKIIKSMTDKMVRKAILTAEKALSESAF